MNLVTPSLRHGSKIWNMTEYSRSLFDPVSHAFRMHHIALAVSPKQRSKT